MSKQSTEMAAETDIPIMLPVEREFGPESVDLSTKFSDMKH
jgi:hypothetical protein